MGYLDLEIIMIPLAVRQRVVETDARSEDRNCDAQGELGREHTPSQPKDLQASFPRWHLVQRTNQHRGQQEDQDGRHQDTQQPVSEPCATRASQLSPDGILSVSTVYVLFGDRSQFLLDSWFLAQQIIENRTPCNDQCRILLQPKRPIEALP
nr:hypothetical protein [Streptomyces sp. DSM 41633]